MCFFIDASEEEKQQWPNLSEILFVELKYKEDNDLANRREICFGKLEKKFNENFS